MECWLNDESCEALLFFISLDCSKQKLHDRRVVVVILVGYTSHYFVCKMQVLPESCTYI